MKAYEFPAHITADGKLALPDTALPRSAQWHCQPDRDNAIPTARCAFKSAESKESIL